MSLPPAQPVFPFGRWSGIPLPAIPTPALRSMLSWPLENSLLRAIRDELRRRDGQDGGSRLATPKQKQED